MRYDNISVITIDSNFMEQLDSRLKSGYIKFDRLQSIIDNYSDKLRNKTIDIFVDVNSIFKSFFNIDNAIYSQIQTHRDALDWVLTGNILNFIAHYRRFFKSKYNAHTRFFIIITLDNPSQRKLYHKYFNPYIPSNRLVLDLIKKNYILLELLTNHINDTVSYMEAQEFAPIVKTIVSKGLSKCDFRITISKDDYNSQLLKDSITDIILRPSKYRGSDGSELIDKNYICDKFGDVLFDPLEELSLIQSICGIKGRLKSLLKINTVTRIINTGYSNGLLCGYSYDIRDKLNILGQIYPKIKKDYFEIENRYKYVDLEHQEVIYKNSFNALILKQMCNYKDPELIAFLEKTFHGYPINHEDF